MMTVSVALSDGLVFALGVQTLTLMIHEVLHVLDLLLQLSILIR